ncbi:MAG: aspartate racemase [Planctomycetes bacterium DG_58]|nr:MAG: aspartate racemase [Planctomycetes bacterium DG_58]KPL04698.1 MAG: aspartate racemase [Planctomycetes bacterium SM23_65]
MKIIGLLGGMSWESTAEYYRLVNEGVKERLGGLHSARILMYSVDFEPIEKLQHAGEWAEAARILIDAARRIEAGGADFLVICTNTMHKLADEISHATGIPILHIADATADRIKSAGMSRVGLLGTKFTMEEEFYKGRLAERHGLDVLIPNDEDRQRVHDVIYDELCVGKIREESKRGFARIIDDLVGRGAEGIILGCTEIGLLVKSGDVDVPLFDTTAIHAAKAVEWALTNDDA